MIRLAPQGPDTVTIDAGDGVTFTLRRVGLAAMLKARRETAAAYRGADVDKEDAAAAAFTAALVRSGMVAWTGVGDAKGKPVQVTPDNVDLLLQNVWIFDKLDREYVGPAVAIDQEKKRLQALTAWHFGGENAGEAYCAACPPEGCEACAYRVHEPQTDAGTVVWEVIRRCGGQVRAVMGAAYGLDFGAVMLTGQALGADAQLLAEVMTFAEPLIVAMYRKED